MVILSVTYLRGGQKNIWWHEAFFYVFRLWRAPYGLSRVPMVLNGQTSVPWEFEIRYSTMGWFHYGNTERYLLERWTKGYLMIWGNLFAVFRHWKAHLRAPEDPQWFSMGQTSVPWEFETKYSTMGWFHYGITEHYLLERWTKGYLMIWGVLFAGPLRAPKDPQCFSMDKLLCQEKSRKNILLWDDFTMGILSFMHLRGG